MCGLLGFATTGQSKLHPDLISYILTQLMERNTGRGGDSFGVAIVRSDPASCVLHKEVGKLREKLYDKAWMSALRDIDDAARSGKPFAVIGHNRKATCGENTVRNAHPFQFGKLDRPDGQFVVGAHNGIVSMHEEYVKAWKITRNVEVDSEVIFRGLQNTLDDGKIIAALRPYAGMALTYMKDPHNLRLYRDSNPLTTFRGTDFMFWSSEQYTLEACTFGLRGVFKNFDKNEFVNVRLSDLVATALPQPLSGPPPFEFPKSDSTSGKGSGSVGFRRGGSHGNDPFADGAPYPSLPTTSRGGPDISSRLSSERTSCDTADRHLFIVGEYPPDKALDPARITMVPRHKLVHDCCTVCATVMEPWQMYWREEEAMCPYCYYYVIQSDAEVVVRDRAKRRIEQEEKLHD
jgi:predicted glutamine amidotransferase